MPKPTGVENKIASIYRRNALNLMLFGFVKGARAALPALAIKDAVIMFMDAYGLEDEDLNIDSAVVSFGRMQVELMDSNKSK